jgi:hypothetical protein
VKQELHHAITKAKSRSAQADGYFRLRLNGCIFSALKPHPVPFSPTPSNYNLQLRTRFSLIQFPVDFPHQRDKFGRTRVAKSISTSIFLAF